MSANTNKVSDARTRDDLLKEIAGLENDVEALSAENQDLENKVGELESELEDIKHPTPAIDGFLDELTRGVGERKFIIPDNSRVHDAIRAMADAVGRSM